MTLFKINASNKEGYRLNVFLECKDESFINVAWEKWLINNPKYAQYNYKIINSTKIK